MPDKNRIMKPRLVALHNTPSTATSRFSWRLRTNWVHRVRRQLTSTCTYKSSAYSLNSGISRSTG